MFGLLGPAVGRRRRCTATDVLGLDQFVVESGSRRDACHRSGSKSRNSLAGCALTPLQAIVDLRERLDARRTARRRQAQEHRRGPAAAVPDPADQARSVRVALRRSRRGSRRRGKGYLGRTYCATMSETGTNSGGGHYLTDQFAFRRPSRQGRCSGGASCTTQRRTANRAAACTRVP